MMEGYNLYDARNANLRHLEHELIASRLDTLVRGLPTRIWSSEQRFRRNRAEETILRKMS